MEEQGIMGLAPQAVGAAPPMPQGMPPEIRDPSPEEQMATADLMYQARKEMPKSEISKEIMAGAAEADPREIAMFKQILSANPLPQELIDALLQMIQLIFENPGDYLEIRQELLAEGVPAELLPETLDLGFFTSLQMALYEVPAAPTEMGIGAMAPMDMAPTAAPPMPPVQGFADGGIATLKPIAQELQGMGRGGDTILAHINPQEARMLKRMGGAGTINPYTGLPEFLKIKNPFKAVANVVTGAAKAIGKVVSSVGKAVVSAVKAVGTAVKKFASSTVGRVVTTVALGFLVGPAAANLLGVSSMAGVAAVSGFVGSGGATLLGGGSVKDALKAGVTGAVLAGGTATVFGGTDAWAAGSYTGPTTIAGQWSRITDSVSKAFSASPTDATGATADPFGNVAKAPTTGSEALGQGTDVAALAENQVSALDTTIPGSPAVNGIPVTGSEMTVTPIPGGEAVTPFDISQTGGAGPNASYLPGDFYADNIAGAPPFDISQTGGAGPNASYLPGDFYADNIASTAGAAEAEAAGLFNQRLASEASGAAFPGEPNALYGNELVPQATTPVPQDPRLAQMIDQTYGDSLAPDYNVGAYKPLNTYATSDDYANLLKTGGYGPDQGGMIVPGESALPEGVYLKGQVPSGYTSPTPAASTSPSFFKDPIGAIKDFYNKNISPSGIEAEARKTANDVYLQARAQGVSEQLATEQAKQALAGTFQKYAPMAGLGVGATLAMLPGAPEEKPLPEDLPVTGQDLLAQSPEIYGVSPGAVTSSYATTPANLGYGDTYTSYIQQLQNSWTPPTLAKVTPPTLAELQSPMFAATAAAPAPATFNMGGFVGNRQGSGIGAFGMGYKRGGMPTQYPRKVGAINGPGTEKSDSIPAMLSDGEFVFTAKAVRGMGSGSRKEGAKKMYAMMKALEGNA